MAKNPPRIEVGDGHDLYSLCEWYEVPFFPFKVSCHCCKTCDPADITVMFWDGDSYINVQRFDLDRELPAQDRDEAMRQLIVLSYNMLQELLDKRTLCLSNAGEHHVH